MCLPWCLDGCFTNHSTAKFLGYKMKVSEIQPQFPHPKLQSSKVYVILDACHMIKLMLNLPGDKMHYAYRTV